MDQVLAHDDIVPPEFIPIEEIGPVYPFACTSHYKHVTLPTFPYLEKNRIVGFPPGANVGFLDKKGRFQESHGGDMLPESGATIGYVDNDGIYHEVMSVEDGVANGQLATREGYKIIKDQVRTGETAHDLKAQVSPGDAAGVVGYDGKDDQLLEVTSNEVIPPNTKSMHKDLKTAEMRELIPPQLQTPGTAGPVTGQDMKQVDPADSAGGVVGYVGKDGQFVEETSNEVISLKPPSKSGAAASGPVTGQDLKQVDRDLIIYQAGIRKLCGCSTCGRVSAGHLGPIILSCVSGHPSCVECWQKTPICGLSSCEAEIKSTDRLSALESEAMRCNPDYPDLTLWGPVGPITTNQAEELESSWKLLAPNIHEFGVAVFIQFFTDHPEYQRIFKDFADIPLEQLAGNVRLAAHAFTVMTAIGGLVYNLNDAEVLSELLIRAGRSHARRHLKVEDFQNLKKSLLEFIAKAFGEHYTPAADVAWTKLLTIMMEKIGEGLAQGD